MQEVPGGQDPLGPQRLWQKDEPQSQLCPSGQGSVSSHRPGVMGTQAAMQSRQSGQLDVAQPSHTEPGPQSAQKPPSHAGAHVPVPKMHTMPLGAHSSCVVQLTGAPPDPPLAPVPPVPVAPVPELPEAPVPVAPVPVAPVPFAPAPPSPPSSTTTVPPHAEAQPTQPRTKSK